MAPPPSSKPTASSAGTSASSSAAGPRAARSMGSVRPPGGATDTARPSAGNMGSARPPSAVPAAASSSSTPSVSQGASASASSNAATGPGAAGGGRFQFKPQLNVRKQRTTPSASPAPSASDAAASSSSRGRGGSSATRGSRGRGGGGRGGANMREQIPLIASGPFSLGPGGMPKSKASNASRLGLAGSSASSSALPGGIVPGSSAASLTGTGPSLKLDPSRFRDARRDLEYAEDDMLSDEDDGRVAVGGGGQAFRMSAADLEKYDDYAPRSLPKYKMERKTKKDKIQPGVNRATVGAADQQIGPAGLPVKAKAEPTDEEPRAPGVMEVDGADAPRKTPEDSEEGEVGVNGRTADALDLSESEDEELMDDLLGYFLPTADGSNLEEKLYLFQFPTPFPSFVVPPYQQQSSSTAKDEDTSAGEESNDGKKAGGGILKRKTSSSRGVVFAADTAGGGGAAGITPSPSSTPQPEARLGSSGSSKVKKEDPDGLGTGSGTSSKRKVPEGRIGTLNVYNDGKIAFHLGSADAARRAALKNAHKAAVERAQSQGLPPPEPPAELEAPEAADKDNFVILDVTGGSPATFLQQLMLLNPQQSTATCLGEIERKFVVTPDLDHVLEDLDLRNM